VSTTPAFDLRRLHELQTLLGSELPSIVATLLGELNRAMAEVRSGIDAGDWQSAELGAHSARNSALMLDARPLLAALDDVERATRRGHRPSATAAGAQLRRVWPELRTQLEAAADPAGD
jgi:hypothetical protein